jgi:site-specific recombinase XerD
MKQKNQAVTLLRYVRTAKGWVRRRVTEGHGKKWDEKIDHNQRAFGDDVIALGEYQVRWYERRNGASQPRYESAGPTFIAACEVVRDREKRLALIRASHELGVAPPVEVTDRVRISDKLEPFLAKRMASKRITSEATLYAYRFAVDEFLEIADIQYVDEVNQGKLADYLNRLHKDGFSDQTQLNRYARVSALLRDCDPGLSKLLTETTPRVAKKKPVSYTKQELEELLAYMYSTKRWKRPALAVEMYWKTGLRERELSYLPWAGIDLDAGYIHIKDSRQLRLRGTDGKEKRVLFRTKTRRDRDLAIPIETQLLERLREWRKLHPQGVFIFPGKNGNPDQEIRAKLKRAANRAGMNCGTCDNCTHPCGMCQYCRCFKCKGCLRRGRCRNARYGGQPCTRIECRKWGLHKLRHTFATTFMRKVGDPSMLMDILGHRKLSTTQKYIGVAKESETQAAINRVFSDKEFGV